MRMHRPVSWLMCPASITWSTMRAEINGVMSAIAALTAYSTIAPMARGRSGLQYAMSQRRLPALRLRFGSTYIVGVLGGCWGVFFR